MSIAYTRKREQAGEVSEGFPYLPFFPLAIPTLRQSAEIWSAACQTDEMHFTHSEVLFLFRLRGRLPLRRAGRRQTRSRKSETL